MAKNTKKMEIVIGAKNKTKAVFKKIRSGFKSLSKGAAKLGAIVTTGMSLGIAAFSAFTVKILDSEDALAKTARQLGLTSNQLATLRQTAKFAGIEVSAMDKAVQFMQRNIAEAADGTASQADAFKALGLSIDEIKKADPTDAMAQIVSALQDVEDQNVKTQVAMDIFGRAGAKLLNVTADSFARASKEVKLFGLAMDDVSSGEVEKINDNITTIKAALSGFSKTVIANLTSPILKASQAVKELAESGSLKLWATQTALVMVQAFQGVTKTVAFLGESIILAGRALNRVRQASAVVLGGFAAAELKLLEAKQRNLQGLIEWEKKAAKERGRNFDVSSSSHIKEIQQIEISIGKYRALADSSVDVFDESGKAADELSNKQGKVFAATDKIVSSLKKTEEELENAVIAQEKLAQNTETSKDKMSGLANETGRAADNMQRLVSISSNLRIPEGQKVLTNEGIITQLRNEGG